MLPLIPKPKAWEVILDSFVCCGGGVWIWACVMVALVLMMMFDSVPR